MLKTRKLIVTVAALVSCFTFISASTGETKSNNDRDKVNAIFEIIDQQMAGSDDYLEHIADDVILMAHNLPVINGKAAYIKHIEDSRGYGQTVIEHQLLETYSYDDVVLARGRAVGTFKANGSEEVNPFETKNLFVFRRLGSGELEIWQTIFNMNP